MYEQHTIILMELQATFFFNRFIIISNYNRTYVSLIYILFFEIYIRTLYLATIEQS